MKDALRQEQLPLSERMSWTKGAFDVFVLQQKTTEAITFCDRLLRIIKDPALTISDSSGGGAEHFEHQRRDAEAAVVNRKRDLSRIAGIGAR